MKEKNRKARKIIAMVLVFCTVFLAVAPVASGAVSRSAGSADADSIYAMELSTRSITLKVGEFALLTAKVYPYNAPQEVTLTVSKFDSTCVDVMGGGNYYTIEGKSVGTVVITVRAAKTTIVDACVVTVVAADSATPTTSGGGTGSVGIPTGSYPVLFKDISYRGDRITAAASAGLAYKPKMDKGHLQNWGMHDCITSVYVPRGWQVTLCTDSAYKGDIYTVIAAAKSIYITKLPGNIDDKVSSIIVEKIADDPTLPVVYEDSGYNGRVQTLTVGRYRKSQLTFGNDKISSIKVPPGYCVTLYDDDGFSDSTKTYMSNVPFVGTLNDKTSSIVVEKIR